MPMSELDASADVAYTLSLAQQIATNIKEKGVAEIELRGDQIQRLMNAGVSMALNTDVARQFGITASVPESKLVWQPEAVTYAGKAIINAGNKQMQVNVNCPLQNRAEPSGEKMLMLSPDAGQIISFANMDAALEGSQILSKFGFDLKTINKLVRDGLSNPGQFMFAGLKEALQPKDTLKPALLDRNIQLNPSTIRAFVTPQQTLKMSVRKI